MADSRMNGNQYDYLRRLDVDELERLLQLAVNPQCDEEDGDYVDALLEVILEKEQEENTGRLSDVDEKWQEFQRHYNTEESKGQHMYYTEETAKPNQAPIAFTSKSAKSHKKLKRILIVAALVAILASLLALPVLGGRSVADMVAQWTDEQFSYGEKTINQELRKEFKELQSELSKQRITNLHLPRYIPAEFQVASKSLYCSPKTGNIKFSILYTAGSNSMIIEVYQNTSLLNIVREKDSSKVEKYMVNGITCYLFENYNNNVAVWEKDRIEYSIDTSLTMDKLKLIIDSI